MVLKPVKIATANRIRVIASLPDATILDLNGQLTIFGQQYPDVLSDESLVHHADTIKAVFKMDGLDELSILLEDGNLTVLRLRKDGRRELVRYDLVERRAIERLAVGLHPQRILVVLRARPSTIYSFSSWKTFLGWTQDHDDTKAYLDVTELPNAVDHLIGNMDAFTALLRGGQSCSLSHQNPALTKAPPHPVKTTLEVLESAAISGSSNLESDAEEPGISALLSDTPSYLPIKPSLASLQVQFLNISAIDTIATHPSSTTTGLITADGVAYLIGPRPKPSDDMPCLPSLSSVEAAKPINLPVPTGITVASIAIGQSHAVILTSNGECYSAGDGKAGQLGIGDKVFAMRAKGEPGVEFHPHEEGPEEYAEQWERMGLDSDEKGKVKEVVAGAETSYLLVEQSLT